MYSHIEMGAGINVKCEH